MANARKTVNFFSAYIKVILEIILILPVLYLLSIIAVSESNRVLLLGAMMIYPIIGILGGKIFSGNKVLRFLSGFVLSALLGTAITLTRLTGAAEIIFCYVTAFVLFYRGMMYTSGEWLDLLPSTAVFVIITIDFIALLIIGIAPALEPYRLLATVSGPFIIVLALFIMNHLNMKQLSDTRSAVSKSGRIAVDKGMNIHNRLWVGIVFVAVLLVSTWQNMIDALKFIAEKLMWLIMQLIGSDDSSGGGSTVSEADDIRGLMEAEEHISNPFWEKFLEILTVVLSVIFVIAIVTLIIIAIYKLVKALSSLMKNLMDKDSSLIEDMGYVDSRESIMDLKDAPKNYIKKLKSRIEELFAREPKYSDMETAEQKATWLYRHAVISAMSSGYKYRMSNTASETLNEIKPDYVGNKNDIDFIDDAYNKVKFSESLPDINKADQLGSSK